MVASLPGNHDLGFASGVQLPVKERFETYFGNVNRLDIIGNHSFISVDTVSLSAMDQVDPNTGSSGVGDGTSHSVANRDIWGPTEDFLAAVRQARNRAVGREIRVLADLPEQLYHDPGLIGYAPNLTGLSEAGKSEHVVDLPAGITEKSFPSILLTHVPLYRAPDTDCGPQREGGHAIFVQGGYQYQNVLTPLISKDIVSKIGVEDIAQVYSGDDHDYCEIEHGEITGRIKEITIKSISMAMGVRRPGFLAVSLHNPVDMQLTANDESKDSAGVKKDTIQNHLCLLPDQISIFLRYAMLLGLSLVVLAIRALMVQYHTRSNNGASKSPLLPLTRENTQRPLNNEKLFRHGVSSSSSSSASPEHAISGRTTISTQRSQARSGSPCGLVGYGNLPAASRSSSPSKAGLDAAFAPARGANVISVDDHDDWGMPRAKRRADIFGQQQRRGMVMEFGHSVGRLAIPVLVFYLWLISRG